MYTCWINFCSVLGKIYAHVLTHRRDIKQGQKSSTLLKWQKHVSIHLLNVPTLINMKGWGRDCQRCWKPRWTVLRLREGNTKIKISHIMLTSHVPLNKWSLLALDSYWISTVHNDYCRCFFRSICTHCLQENIVYINSVLSNRFFLM